MTVENFFALLTVPIPDEEVEIWFNVNNMTIEKRQLYADLCLSLVYLINETYLGEELDKTNPLVLSQNEKNDHFEWCWKKTIDNFSKEGLKFKYEGEHKEYFKEFFDEVFYNQKDDNIINNIPKFLESLFNEETIYTQTDLNMITEIYKLFDKSYL
jgi:hypothetical protein